MPGYKVHLLGGGALAGAALGGVYWLEWYRPDPLIGAFLVAVALLASLFPDTDTNSKGRPFFYGVMAFTDVVLLANEEYKWAALLGLFAMLPAIGNHRGWTHTWWAMLAVPLPILLLPMVLFESPWQPLLPFYCAAILGYGSHLALDRQY